MEKCVYCGADTVLTVADQPVCVACDAKLVSQPKASLVSGKEATPTHSSKQITVTA